MRPGWAWDVNMKIRGTSGGRFGRNENTNQSTNGLGEMRRRTRGAEGRQIMTIFGRVSLEEPSKGSMLSEEGPWRRDGWTGRVSGVGDRAEYGLRKSQPNNKQHKKAERITCMVCLCNIVFFFPGTVVVHCILLVSLAGLTGWRWTDGRMASNRATLIPSTIHIQSFQADNMGGWMELLSSRSQSKTCSISHFEFIQVPSNSSSCVVWVSGCICCRPWRRMEEPLIRLPLQPHFFSPWCVVLWLVLLFSWGDDMTGEYWGGEGTSIIAVELCPQLPLCWFRGSLEPIRIINVIHPRIC